MNNLKTLAQTIYTIIYGDEDTGQHRPQTEQEIEDWLSENAESLATEYEDLIIRDSQ